MDESMRFAVLFSSTIVILVSGTQCEIYEVDVEVWHDPQDWSPWMQQESRVLTLGQTL